MHSGYIAEYIVKYWYKDGTYGESFFRTYLYPKRRNGLEEAKKFAKRLMEKEQYEKYEIRDGYSSEIIEKGDNLRVTLNTV